MSYVDCAIRVLRRRSGKDAEGFYETILVSLHKGNEYAEAFEWILYRANLVGPRFHMQRFSKEDAAHRAFPNGSLTQQWVVMNDWLAELALNEEPLADQRTYYRRIPLQFFGGSTKVVKETRPVPLNQRQITTGETMLLEALARIVDETRLLVEEDAGATEGEYAVVSADPEAFPIVEEPDTRVWLFHALRATVDAAAGAWPRDVESSFIVYLEYRLLEGGGFANAKLLYSWKSGLAKSAKKHLVRSVRALSPKYGVSTLFSAFHFIIGNVHRGY